MTKLEYRCDHAAGRFGNPACAIAGRIDSLPAQTSFRHAYPVPLGKNLSCRGRLPVMTQAINLPANLLVSNMRKDDKHRTGNGQ